MNALVYATLMSSVAVGQTDAPRTIKLDAVLTLLDEVRVPARDAGILAKLDVRPGVTVKANAVLGRLDETKAKLVREQAQLEVNHAERLAGHDLKIRLARKTYDVAAAELKRANAAAKRFEKSVSQSELDRLRLETERAGLEIDQSQFDFETAQLAVDAKKVALRLAAYDLARRLVVTRSPGTVVEVLKQPGEWVEPGETVVRLVRMDRLRAEGFLPAAVASAKLIDKPVQLVVKLSADKELKLAGKLTFVSPEIHPVNGMVRVWAEIPNRESAVRPGLQASMSILP